MFVKNLAWEVWVVDDGSNSNVDVVAARLAMLQCSLTGVLAVYLYVSDIAHFALVNNIYVNYFSVSPPARWCSVGWREHITFLYTSCI